MLGEWDDVRVHSDYARTHEAFPSEVADALAFIAAEDVVGYVEAVEDVLESFETRDEYLEDIPVADTVLVLQALAAAARWPPSSSRAAAVRHALDALTSVLRARLAAPPDSPCDAPPLQRSGGLAIVVRRRISGLAGVARARARRRDARRP